ncbi:hypothetical protein KAI87_14070 [Myxococcota bacterium]|nr:hypothetical protein [Myxococcota bacterium]
MHKIAPLVLLPFLALPFLACGEDADTGSDAATCDELQCGEHEICDSDATPVGCICESGYVNEGDGCINTKSVPCEDSAPEHALSTQVQVEVSWDRTSWSAADYCLWECDEGYTLDAYSCTQVASVPYDGFGTISGSCGVLDTAELTTTASTLVVNAIDFESNPYDASDYNLLTSGGKAIADAANAGGSSTWSEVFSYEVLYRCELAELLKTETEITYDSVGKMTDALVEIDDLKIGVSVTRAMTYPPGSAYQESNAIELLTDKLNAIQESSAIVSTEDEWEKQILHVICENPDHLAVFLSALEQIDVSVKADTIIMITTTNGDDEFIYTNQI